jgi:succinoglycan biosynthesis transport protein ExoP
MSSSPRSRPARPAPAPGPRPVPAFDLRHPVIVLRAHLWQALALALVTCTLVAWQMMRQPREYAASAVLFFEREEPRPTIVHRDEYPDHLDPDLTLSTRLEQLRSLDMAKRVVASLSPDERARVLAPYAGPGPAAPADLEGVVRGAMSFSRKPGTLLILITAAHRDPGATALLANRFAEQCIQYTLERGQESNNASLAFLREQAEDMRRKTEAAERALQEYRQRYNLVSLEDNQNIIVDNLKSLNTSATAARVARFAAEARLEQAEAVIKRGDDAAALAAVIESDSLSQVSRRLADLRGKRAVLAERYGRRHPAMQENQREIEALEKLRDDEQRTVLSGLRDRATKAAAEERRLADLLKQAEKAALDLDELGIEYNVLRRTLDSHKATYTQILTRLNDASISSQLRGLNLKISERASVPASPVSPNPRRTLLLTGALALALVFGYPFTAEMFFGRVRSALDVEHHLGATVLGEITFARRVQVPHRPVIVNEGSDEIAVEQFRGLYSQLALTSRLDPPKTLLVTSAQQGEGKSFIAANLAQSCVAHGRRTLLVDADLRRPTQHRNFGLDGRAGILRWIEEGGRPDAPDLRSDERLGLREVLPGLWLLRAGGTSRKATELLDTGPLSGLLRALQREFDILILDTPPAGIFSDAAAFARLSHELVFVCRFNAVSRHVVRDVLERLRQTELEFAGIVLNGMPGGFGGTYYYKHSSYRGAKDYEAKSGRG